MVGDYPGLGGGASWAWCVTIPKMVGERPGNVLVTILGMVADHHWDERVPPAPALLWGKSFICSQHFLFQKIFGIKMIYKFWNGFCMIWEIYLGTFDTSTKVRRWGQYPGRMSEMNMGGRSFCQAQPISSSSLPRLALIPAFLTHPTGKVLPGLAECCNSARILINISQG